MSDDVDERIAVAVDFWDGYFMVDDKRATFRDALAVRLADDLAPRGHSRTEVDYDPKGALLLAVRDAGIACGGYMCSADGIFSRRQTRLRILPDRVVAIRGYGGPTETIWEAAS